MHLKTSAMFVGLLALIPAAGFAATIQVTNTLDSCTSPPPGSLRWAVGTASAGDTIQVVTPGTVNLTCKLNVPAFLTIIGNSSFVIDGSSIGGLSCLPIMDMLGATSLQGINISGGSKTSGIAGIGTGKLEFFGGSISNNDCTGNGGAIYWRGELDIRDSVFSNNSATGSGGAIYSETFASVSVLNSTFNNNDAGARGGAIFVDTNGSIEIGKSTFTDNESASTGGAVYMESSVGSYTPNYNHIYKSTFEGNTADEGGAITKVGDFLDLDNSTFSENAAVTYGGALTVDNNAEIYALQATFFKNTSGTDGSIAAGRSSGTIIFDNSIVSNWDTTVGGVPVYFDPPCHDIDATADFGGDGSLHADSANTCLLYASKTFEPDDPKLGALANNGGSTETHEVMSGSSAIDNALNSICLTDDQRGVTRTGDCWIGSYQN